MINRFAKLLKEANTDCLFGWYGRPSNVFHNCKLPKGHKGKHKCIVKYRGTDIEQPCKSTKERNK